MERVDIVWAPLVRGVGIDVRTTQSPARRGASPKRHAGWVALADMYDDGGLSGGSMERPALKRLLEDIKTGKVQIIVVYKVDRLTRSLADFAKTITRRSCR